MRWAAVFQGLLAAAVIVATSHELPELIGPKGAAVFGLFVAAGQAFNAARIVALRNEVQQTTRE